MPATPTDIAAASRDATFATWSDAAIAARYPTARDATISPAPGYFDLVADGVTVATARGTLIGTERERFAIDVADLVWPDLSTGIPQLGLIDVEQALSASALTARIELDLDAEATTYESFG